jgi:oxalate decarboxylase/phosphoglucose isomerase-like protein (cupin superfamily)
VHRSWTRPLLGALAVVLALAGAACGSDDAITPSADANAASTATTVAAEPVVREILDELVDPPGAVGRTLTLARYTIAPGAALSPHIHPGVQMASIESGTLTYTVESGTATVRRAGSTEPEAITGPNTTTLGPGDSVTELGDMVHFGANDTDAPVVILAALLTDSDQGLSVTVTAPPTTV